MKAWLLMATDRLRGSYWFLPAVMAAGAMALAAAMIYADSRIGSAWMDGVPWLYAARPDGARQLLSAIGGSMITVAGTVFSVTIAAVVYASGQYGPRLLSNFMADRGNQVTLGTFIATFLYSMLVLRTIRSPGESGGAADAFVPQLALLVGVVLVLCSIGVLIFFIHHVPMRIHINNVIERIGEHLLGSIGARFPSVIGADAAERQEGAVTLPATAIETEWTGVTARRTGYVQFIDPDALMRLAVERDLLIRLHCQPGDFTHAGRVLASVWPARRCAESDATAIRECVTLGSRRSALQDMRFLIEELVEIAARALSPGVNDPFTARTCIDWLGAALGDIAQRVLPSSDRLDTHGTLRVIAHPVEFDGFLRLSFGALAQYAAQDRIIATHILTTLGEIALAATTPDRIAAIRGEAVRFVDLACRSLEGANREAVEARGAELVRAIDTPHGLERLRERPGWLGGSA